MDTFEYARYEHDTQEYRNAREDHDEEEEENRQSND